MNSNTKCNVCGNIRDGSSCIPRIIIGRNEYNRIPYGIEAVLAKIKEETDINSHCPSCNVNFNAFHLFSCEVENCPRCGYQLISCDFGVG